MCTQLLHNIRYRLDTLFPRSLTFSEISLKESNIPVTILACQSIKFTICLSQYARSWTNHSPYTFMSPNKLCIIVPMNENGAYYWSGITYNVLCHIWHHWILHVFHGVKPNMIKQTQNTRAYMRGHTHTGSSGSCKVG